MAEEDLSLVHLSDNYYRDSFGKVVFILVGLVISVLFLLCLSFYIYNSKPKPITFNVSEGMRVMAPVPIDQQHLSNADMLQWVSDTVPHMFDVDFMHVDAQIDAQQKYFTPNGFEVYSSQIKNYINKEDLLQFKIFTIGKLTGAPFVLKQGVLSGRYAWWVQIPINLSYAGAKSTSTLDLRMQVLVVRTETTNNLTGVLIDNMIIEKGDDNSLMTAGKQS